MFETYAVAIILFLVSPKEGNKHTILCCKSKQFPELCDEDYFHHCAPEILNGIAAILGHKRIISCE